MRTHILSVKLLTQEQQTRLNELTIAKKQAEDKFDASRKEHASFLASLGDGGKASNFHVEINGGYAITIIDDDYD